VVDRGTVGATLKKTPDASLEIIGADGLSKKARQGIDWGDGEFLPVAQSFSWRSLFLRHSLIFHDCRLHNRSPGGLSSTLWECEIPYSSIPDVLA
jgi:hypothetical protein